MRYLLALLSFVAVFAAAVPAASAQDDSPDAVERAKAEVERAGTMTQRASELAADGDRDAAYDLARTAYLDHFEYAEIPLRLREPDLVLRDPQGPSGVLVAHVRLEAELEEEPLARRAG